MSYDPLDPDGDCFKPPAVPTEVHCIHCHEEYDSYLIEWRIETDPNGKKHGFWCCPTAGCDGKGFGFDIHPTDPQYQGEHGGWSFDDEEEEGDQFIPEDEGEWSPEDDEEEWTPADADAVIEEAMASVELFNAEEELAEILKDIDESSEADDDDDDEVTQV